MIRGSHYFKTEAEAVAYGEEFKKSLGYGYGPSYSVGFSRVTGAWYCLTCRYSSCD